MAKAIDLLEDASSLITYVERHEDQGFSESDALMVQIAQAKALIAIGTLLNKDKES